MKSTERAASVSKSTVFFDRHELRAILTLYGKMVAAGEWRDYAMDALSDRAVFSIFRRTSEAPLYQVEKRPQEARRQGLYAVVTPAGFVLRRGHELGRVLEVLEPRRMRVVEL
ncbi:MAG: DUF2794 domain-containing protein [Hyphomonadaceae bacterium]